jgi:hypothetical protein
MLETLWVKFFPSSVFVLFVNQYKMSNNKRNRYIISDIKYDFIMFQNKYNTYETIAAMKRINSWSRLHLQSLAPAPVSRRVDVSQTAGLKNSCRIIITHHSRFTPVGTEEALQILPQDPHALPKLFSYE